MSEKSLKDKIYQFVVNEGFMISLKIWAAKTGKSIKAFLIEAASEKAEREKLK